MKKTRITHEEDDNRILLKASAKSLFETLMDAGPAKPKNQSKMNPEPSCSVTCPSCFETFSVSGPAPSETPTEWDYDCEVCCRPMLIRFYFDDDEVVAEAETED